MPKHHGGLKTGGLEDDGETSSRLAKSRKGIREAVNVPHACVHKTLGHLLGGPRACQSRTETRLIATISDKSPSKHTTL